MAMDVESQKLASKLCGGRAGALDVLINIWQLYGLDGLKKVEASGLVGTAIWQRYKDVHRQDLTRFMASLA